MAVVVAVDFVVVVVAADVDASVVDAVAVEFALPFAHEQFVDDNESHDEHQDDQQPPILKHQNVYRLYAVPAIVVAERLHRLETKMLQDLQILHKRKIKSSPKMEIFDNLPGGG